MENSNPLLQSFFDEPADIVAQKLLGKYLVRVVDGEKMTGMVVETEAYLGEEDLAAHASKGRTKRTEVLYGESGRAYVYRIHQQHCLNVVTEKSKPTCVLFRAIEPISGIEMMHKFRPSKSGSELTNGPGKLCQALNITTDLYGVDMTDKSSPLYLSEGETVDSKQIIVGPRIGITKAVDLPLRFYLKDNSFVSR